LERLNNGKKNLLVLLGLGQYVPKEFKPGSHDVYNLIRLIEDVYPGEFNFILNGAKVKGAPENYIFINDIGHEYVWEDNTTDNPYLAEIFKNTKIDITLWFGPISHMQSADPSYTGFGTFAKPPGIAMGRGAKAITFVNNCKYIIIGIDPLIEKKYRILRQLTNPPSLILANGITEYEFKKLYANPETKSNDVVETWKVTSKFVPFGKLLTYGIPPINEPKEPNSIKIMLSLGGRSVAYRKKQVNEILKAFPKVEFYGKWTDKYEPKNYKGCLDQEGIRETFKNTKYTYITGNEFGWVTAKIYELANMGVLCFVPRDFDSKKLIPIPKILRIGSSVQMKMVIKKLENNPELYQKTLEEQEEIFKQFPLENVAKAVVEAGLAIGPSFIGKEYKGDK